jgi:hypothetical protein
MNGLEQHLARDYEKMNVKLAKIEAELDDMLKPRFPSEPTKAQQNKKLLINATASVAILFICALLAWLNGYNFDSRGYGVSVYTGCSILLASLPLVLQRE